MNINDLTLGQLKDILAMAKNYNFLIDENNEKNDEFVGKYVICRCESAGVHAGYLVSQDKDVVVLKDSRRLWSWGCKKGIALSGVAQYGLDEGRKIDVNNSLIRLTKVIETILCSKDAEVSINEY